MKKNQVYFDLAEFANDLFEIRAKRKATYKDMATEANTTVTIVSNLFNAGKCSADTLACLSAWANLDPRDYFIVNSYE